MTLYSIYDRVADTYKMPFTGTNDNVAERNFRILVNEKGSEIYFTPGDYDLYKVAEWDERHGNIVPAKKLLVNGNNVKETRSDE